MAKAIEKISDRDVSIKWVNDILVEGKKVCGILTEGAVSMESGLFDYAVVGIGINIREPEGGWPEEIMNVAGSVCRNNENINESLRARLVAETINEFMIYYRALPEKIFLDDYKKRCNMVGESVYVIDSNHPGNISAEEIIKQSGDKLKTVKVIGIDDDLGLVVEDENGHTEILRSGEVSVRKIK